MSDYKNTLNLPETIFPMKANLSQKEPELLKFWESINAYSLMIKANQGQESYVLHDGPPYANGHIHLGTALNKILKDIVVKSRNLQGFSTEYVPGWDCHGLPIEHKVEQELGEKKKGLPHHVIRKRCRAYAEKYLDIQRKEFKRLGNMGVWDKPYMTMAADYEAETAKNLGRFLLNGEATRSKKPIYWCTSCQTALAEAEVEYADHSSPSIYIRFPIFDEQFKQKFSITQNKKAYITIWTTTPWTIPDNMAVMVNPELEYLFIEKNNNIYILAKELLQQCLTAFAWQAEDIKVAAEVKGADLEGIITTHPIYNRVSPIILSNSVNLEAGTGCVHCAPGHGPDDYEASLKYNLEIYSPIDAEGKFQNIIEFFAGLHVFAANPKVIEKLEELGNLLGKKTINHSYPHCWRCKKPVIFRATTQWFVSMSKNHLRQKALEAIRNTVYWIPAWGEERIYSMIENRPDWCISRQRLWGVPIIALLCEGCDEAWYSAEWIEDITDKFAKHPTGCDYWFETDISEIAPKNLTCPHCHRKDWRKETDILDVWFDSGSSFAAVLEKRPECKFPADLYLEGSDQHRGWFHSSLLISVGLKNIAPYKSVLTHGYVVDAHGKKMSKSLGNVIAPQEVIDKYGAEILRLWVSSVDYREDIRISDEILSRLIDAYRRLRNTTRYILGNINDFDLKNLVSFEDMDPLDRYACHLSSEAHQKMQTAYLNFEFHKVFHTLHNLCVTDLSAFYFDILKDRLYVSAKNGKERTSAQSALLYILNLLLLDMAPILSFTSEEIFRNIPEQLKTNVPTVFALKCKEEIRKISTQELALWEMIKTIRSEAAKVSEPLRKEGIIGHSLDTHLELYLNDEQLSALTALADKTDLRAVFIVSKLSILPLSMQNEKSIEIDELEEGKVYVHKAPGKKCERCWVYCELLGQNPDYPTLCPHCASILKSNR